MEDYKEKYKIGDRVRGKRTFNGKEIEGEFNGFHLFNKLNPNSVVCAIITDDGCYDVSVDSLEFVENENERISKEIISFITDRQNWFPKEETKVSWIAWLEKQGEQNPSWSEEDEEMKLDTIKAFQLAYLYATEEENPRKRNIDWLKSIKPNHWKPSEEQLLSLQEAISIVGENSISGRNLIEILEQLKNL